jgi:hypothetical protein
VTLLVLHPYAPGVRPADQQPCWEALADLRFTHGYDVLDYPCVGPFGYRDALASVWYWKADVVIVEHDIVPSPLELKALEVCPLEFCAFDYQCHGKGTWSEIPEGLGLGLSKLSLKARRSVLPTPQVPKVPWADLAGNMRDRLPPVHLHPQLADHRHTYT